MGRKNDLKRKLLFISYKKDKASGKKMCEDSVHPDKLQKFYDAVRNIGYDETPNYDHLWHLWVLFYWILDLSAENLKAILMNVELKFHQCIKER